MGMWGVQEKEGSTGKRYVAHGPGIKAMGAAGKLGQGCMWGWMLSASPPMMGRCNRDDGGVMERTAGVQVRGCWCWGHLRV